MKYRIDTNEGLNDEQSKLLDISSDIEDKLVSDGYDKYLHKLDYDYGYLFRAFINSAFTILEFILVNTDLKHKIYMDAETFIFDQLAITKESFELGKINNV